MRNCGELKDEPFIPMKTAVSSWNDIHPDLLDITGGEPFVYPNFVKFLSGLDKDISLAMTTNLYTDLTEFVSEIPASRFRSITVSYHPSQRMGLDCFLGKALLLQHRGFHVNVNFVAYPEQMWMIPKLKEVFEKENRLKFHVDPYSQTKFHSFDFNDEEKAWLSEWIGKDRKQIAGVRPVQCSAGMDRIVVFPDGLIYGCLRDKIDGKDPMGYLGHEFEPNKKYGFCANANVCAGCDRDHVTIENT